MQLVGIFRRGIETNHGIAGLGVVRSKKLVMVSSL